MGLSWGWCIPAGVVVASFRSFNKVGSAWFYVHVISASLGLLLSLAGTAVACYFSAAEKLQHQHKVIGIVVQVVAGLQASSLLPVP